MARYQTEHTLSITEKNSRKYKTGTVGTCFYLVFHDPDTSNPYTIKASFCLEYSSALRLQVTLQ